MIKVAVGLAFLATSLYRDSLICVVADIQNVLRTREPATWCQEEQLLITFRFIDSYSAPAWRMGGCTELELGSTMDRFHG